jgi:hypothetical protein
VLKNQLAVTTPMIQITALVKQAQIVTEWHLWLAMVEIAQN